MSKDLPPSRVAPQFVVRLPSEEFRDQIADAAKHNNRSMNAEIVARLQDSFQERPAVDTTRLRQLEATLEFQTHVIQRFSKLLQQAGNVLDQEDEPLEGAVATIRDLGRQLSSALAKMPPTEHPQSSDQQGVQSFDRDEIIRGLEFSAQLSEDLRTSIGSMLLSVVELVPQETREKHISEYITVKLAQWLSEKDPRGALYSLLRMIDGSDPDIVEAIRHYAEELDVAGLMRKQRIRLSRVRPANSYAKEALKIIERPVLKEVPLPETPNGPPSKRGRKAK